MDLCGWKIFFPDVILIAANEIFFIVFSENENDVVSNYFMRKEKKIGLLSAFQSIKEQIIPTRTKKAF